MTSISLLYLYEIAFQICVLFISVMAFYIEFQGKMIEITGTTNIADLGIYLYWVHLEITVCVFLIVTYAVIILPISLVYILSYKKFPLCLIMLLTNTLLFQNMFTLEFARTSD